jgi:hypothetical protein
MIASTTKLVPPAKSEIVSNGSSPQKDGYVFTCQLIELKGEGYCKEKELIADCD